MATKNYAFDEAPPKKLPQEAFDIDALLNTMEKSISNERPPAILGFFGGPGSAKTTAAMKMAQNLLAQAKTENPNAKILYVDSAKGRATMIDRPELTADVIPMQFQKLEQLWALADAIRDQSKKVFANVAVVVLDEYSSMAQYDVNWITEARARVAELEGEYKDPYKPEWPDYAAGANRSLKTIQKFAKLPGRVHILFTAHDKYYEKEKITRPDMPAATAKDFERLIHGLYYCTVKTDTHGNETFNIQTKPVRMIGAKNRVKGLATNTTVEELIAQYNKWGIDPTLIASEETRAEQVKVLETSEESLFGNLNTNNPDDLLN